MDRKRKFTFYQEPPFASMAPQVSDRAPAPRPPAQPTPETQELYNLMRQEEERRSLTQESLQQVQDGTNDYLQLPSPSQATTSSPSHGSTTQSIAGALHAVDLNAALPPANKPKPGRKGRLSEVSKLRTNLMRKLKACPDCNRRRVKCTHHDLSLFDAAYQETRQDRRAPAQALDPSDSTWESAGLYQPSLGEPNDLIGVGGLHDSALQPAIATSGGRENQTEFDPLREQSHYQQSVIQPHVISALNSVENYLAAPNPSSSQYQSTAPSHSLPVPQYTEAAFTTPGTVTRRPHAPAPTSQPMTMRHSQGFAGTSHRVQATPTRRVSRPTLWTRQPERYFSTAQAVPMFAFQGAAATSQVAPTASYQAPAVPLQSLPADGPPVLMGKQESIPNGVWVCAGISAGAGGSTSPGGSVHCNQMFYTLDDLKQHFRWDHAPFYNDVSNWVCGNRCLPVLTEEPSPTSPCQQCRQFTMQRWHWASILSPATLASSPLVRVTSQDGTRSSHSSQTGYSTQLSSPNGGGYSGSPYTSYPSVGYYRYPSSSGQYSNCAQAESEKDGVTRPREAHTPPPPTIPTPPPPYYEAKSESKIKTIVSSPAFPYPYSQSGHCPLNVCPLNGSTTTTALDAAKSVGAMLFRHRHACPAAAVLLVVVIAVVDAWLYTGGGGSGGGTGVLAQVCSGVGLLREGSSGRGVGIGVGVRVGGGGGGGGGGCVVGMEELAVVCIGAGMVAMWVWRHVKVRVRRVRRGREMEREREGEVGGLWDEGVGVAW